MAEGAGNAGIEGHHNNCRSCVMPAKRLIYSGLTKTSTALPRLSSKRTIL
ncbi:hypothetical protein NEIPOLOT_00781 [Neisseria polysaccharea ATCC 43768]|nr:hypothetical protein NEIPOLOT_00781 [Neisseria polysaccharea ATCC 43768]